MTVLYPSGYRTAMVTLDKLKDMHRPHMHPEAFRRHFAFIEAKGGKFGIGGGWRDDGTQPDKPGFAPEGKSFHQNQKFPSGIFYVALDMVVVNPGLVHRAPRWSEVPRQGSQEAIDFGVHMNVTTEAWHQQPIELDGYDLWVIDGCPDLIANYPIKGQVVPVPPKPNPIPTPEDEDDMKEVYYNNEEGRTFEGAVYEPGRIKFLLLDNGDVRRIDGEELEDRGHPNVDVHFGIPKSNTFLDARHAPN